MDFISDAIRAKWASASRIGDMLIRGTEVSVSRKGFTPGSEGTRDWKSMGEWGGDGDRERE